MKRRTEGVLAALGPWLLFIAGGWSQPVSAQPIVPAISARPKGPDQINLTWPPVTGAGYGYLVEIQSSGDGRYPSWTELQPIPTAAGYTCSTDVYLNGARCNVSDPAGIHVHNPRDNGIPYWVTDAQYLDPQDGSAAQFIASGLKPDTSYSFRVRSYSGSNAPAHGTYSNVVTVRTDAYPARYVSPAGQDSNDGKGPDPAHAWRSLAHSTRTLACGQVLIVMGGTYAADQVQMSQQCTAAAKAVVLVNPGDIATLTSQPAGAAHAIKLAGRHAVIDGLRLASSSVAPGEYDVEIPGDFNALFNVEASPPVVPSFKFGVAVYGGHNLLYRCYLHDYGSPDPVQNPGGNGGFILALLWPASTDNVIWSNHLTRGGHDESLCKGGCSHNRWLNNVMDGGWGEAWIAVFNGWASDHNLVEGNVIKSVGQLVPYFKPAIQVSGAGNTVRRNIVIQSRTWALEVSSFTGGSASSNLIHNNVFYSPGGCYFQSSSRGARAYYNVIYANNICYKMQNLATQIYLGNNTNRIAANDFLFVGTAGKPLPEQPSVIWNQLGGGTFETPKPVGAADRTYDPPFSRNRSLSAPPEFVDEANADFHLSAGSPLTAAGLSIANLSWGSSIGAVDLGAFGLNVAPANPWPPGEAMERARASDYATALKDLRAGPALPNAPALEAALLRADDDDAGAAAVLARMGPPAAGDLMGRFERTRQGNADPALWESLTAAPDRALNMADLYLQWGLARDALELLGHKGPAGAPSPDDALFLYYRSYCRALLNYEYYAAEDLRMAATKALQEVPSQLGAALAVLQSAIQRNPVDANAQYLIGTLQHNAGRPTAARDALESALQLRPGFPEAERLLAKLPPDNTAGRKRPAGITAAPAISRPGQSRDILAAALRIAASGDVRGAMSYFTPANFPKEKDDLVREAYFELRLRRLLAAAASAQCSGIGQAIAAIDVEDKLLPFTSGGFADFTKRARAQYLLGEAELACGDPAGARVRWEKVSKADAAIASADYAYPYLALAKLEPEVGKARSRTALVFLGRQLGAAAPAYQGTLLYSQGLLQTAVGRKSDAMSSFRAGAEAGPACLWSI